MIKFTPPASGQITRVVEQVLAGQVDCHQRRRTGCVEDHARSLQTQQVGHSSRNRAEDVARRPVSISND